MRLVTQFFYPIFAGAAVRFSRYIPGFQERGIELDIVTGTPTTVKAATSGILVEDGGLRRSQKLSPESFHNAPVRRIVLPSNPGFKREWIFMRRLRQLCTPLGNRPDVIHFLWLPPATIPLLHVLRRNGIACVFTQTMTPDRSSHPVKRMVRKWSLLVRLGQLNCVVVNSEAMRGSLRAIGFSGRIEVIPNGVDLVRFRPLIRPENRLKIRKQLEIGETDTVLVYVGAVSERKGVGLLLEAWADLATRHRQVHLLLVGPRRDLNDPTGASLRCRIQTLSARSGAGNRVHFVGLVENVEDYLRAADIFVFASRREGLPNAVLEAMASGLPVVTTPFLGLSRELGSPESHFILAEFDARSLVARIEELLYDTGRRRLLGDAARKWVESEMGIDRSIDRYTALYRDLAGAASQGEPE